MIGKLVKLMLLTSRLPDKSEIKIVDVEFGTKFQIPAVAPDSSVTV